MAVEGRVETLQRLDTELYADTTEWCPLPGFQRVLLCGTYQLVEQVEEAAGGDPPQGKAQQTRKGQLRVYQLADDEETPRLEHLHTLAMPGVLDIKWSGGRREAGPVFGLVNSEGLLELWTLPEAPECSMSAPVRIAQESLSPNSVALALDWSTVSEGSGPQTVVASDSSGTLSVFDVHQSVQLQQQWHAHSMEAWTCAIHSTQPCLVYSGADDFTFKGWDLRAGIDTPIFIKNRHMGVCCIRNGILRPHLLAVGSYDEAVELWDTRQMRSVVGRGVVGGGVWRVKWDPHSSSHLLTASMHNGFHVLDCSAPDMDPLPISHHYPECELGYGADWCHLPPVALPGSAESAAELQDLPTPTPRQHLVATCSFYDHSLHLWRCCW